MIAKFFTEDYDIEGQPFVEFRPIPFGFYVYTQQSPGTLEGNCLVELSFEDAKTLVTFLSNHIESMEGDHGRVD